MTSLPSLEFWWTDRINARFFNLIVVAAPVKAHFVKKWLKMNKSGKKEWVAQLVYALNKQ